MTQKHYGFRVESKYPYPPFLEKHGLCLAAAPRDDMMVASGVGPDWDAERVFRTIFLSAFTMCVPVVFG